jgi:hypothetical protein
VLSWLEVGLGLFALTFGTLECNIICIFLASGGVELALKSPHDLSQSVIFGRQFSHHRLRGLSLLAVCLGNYLECDEVIQLAFQFHILDLKVIGFFQLHLQPFVDSFSQ